MSIAFCRRSGTTHYLFILCIPISLLTGSRLNFSRTATIIYTGFNCDGYTRLGYAWPKPAAFMRPDNVPASFDARFPRGKLAHVRGRL